MKRLGGEIYTHSPVVAVDTGSKAGVKIKTESGQIKADYLLVTGNAYLKNIALPKLKPVMKLASDIQVTQPLNAQLFEHLLPHNDAVANARFVVDYFRTTADRRLLFGGRAGSLAASEETRFTQLRRRMEAVFPQLEGVDIDYRWSGNVGLTLNLLPDLGRINSTIYYAQGYSGHGVALANLSGALIAAAISGDNRGYDALSQLAAPALPTAIHKPFLALALLWFKLRDRTGF